MREGEFLGPYAKENARIEELDNILNTFRDRIIVDYSQTPTTGIVEVTVPDHDGLKGQSRVELICVPEAVVGQEDMEKGNHGVLDARAKLGKVSLALAA